MGKTGAWTGQRPSTRPNLDRRGLDGAFLPADSRALDMYARGAEETEAQREEFFQQAVAFLQRALAQDKNRAAAVEAYGTLLLALHGTPAARAQLDHLFAFLRRTLAVKQRPAAEAQAAYACLRRIAPCYGEDIAEPVSALLGARARAHGWCCAVCCCVLLCMEVGVPRGRALVAVCSPGRLMCPCPPVYR